MLSRAESQRVRHAMRTLAVVAALWRVSLSIGGGASACRAYGEHGIEKPSAAAARPSMVAIQRYRSEPG